MNTKELTGGMRVLAIIVSGLMIIAGIVLLFDARLLVWAFFVSVTARGISTIANYVVSKGARRGWDLICGAIDILFGSVMLFGGAETRVAGILAIEIFIAVWLLFAGFAGVFSGFGLKKEGVKGWGKALAGGILMILAGILFLLWPLMSTVALVGILGIFTGISFIIVGTTGLVGAFSSRETKA